MDIMFGSIETALAVTLTNGATKLVWPKEGEFKGNRFVFNEAHEGFEPLMLDSFTASAVTQVYKALNDENKLKVANMLKASRGHFMKFVEFCWSKC